jgi:Mrp family chromosome partitioning ATPase
MMGLIEKASGGRAGMAAEEQMLPPESPHAAPSLFDLDFPALAAAGFYTPAARSERLSLELRAIKRRLLRRMGLRAASGERKIVRRTGRNRNLVLVTSTRPGEGKTFCAINLALSLAFEEEMEVLLIDADLSRPKVRSHFGIPEAPGLTDRIQDTTLSVTSLCWRARQAPLTILPEGRAQGRPIDLFSSPEAQRLFAELSSRRAGRIVIIDAPPVLATEEASILAREADEALFVIEADHTPEPAAAAALDELLEANANVSLLLNRCLIGAGSNYYGSYDDYGRGKTGEAEARPQASGE